MPLLTTTETATLGIAEAANHLVGFLSAAISNANKMTSTALALSNDDLQAWLTAKPWEQRSAEFAAHGQLGDALNAAAAVAEGALGVTLPRVDVRSVPEKLAEQYREIQITENGITIADLPRPETPPDTP